MEAVDEIIWSVSPVHDNLQGIILRIREFVIPLAESGGFTFEVRMDPGIEQLNLPANIRQNLYLMLKEAVNNLAKYSGASAAGLVLEKQKHLLCVVVHDNGKGFDPDVASGRNGLKNMKIRADEIRARLEISSSDAGTRISFWVPI